MGCKVMPRKLPVPYRELLSERLPRPRSGQLSTTVDTARETLTFDLDYPFAPTGVVPLMRWSVRLNGCCSVRFLCRCSVRPLSSWGVVANAPGPVVPNALGRTPVRLYKRCSVRPNGRWGVDANGRWGVGCLTPCYAGSPDTHTRCSVRLPIPTGVVPFVP